MSETGMSNDELNKCNVKESQTVFGYTERINSEVGDTRSKIKGQTLTTPQYSRRQLEAKCLCLRPPQGLTVCCKQKSECQLRTDVSFKKRYKE